MVRYMTTSPSVYVFSRTVDDSNVVVMVNIGKDTEEVDFISTKPENGENIINYFNGEHEGLPATLAPGEYRVYVAK